MRRMSDGSLIKSQKRSEYLLAQIEDTEEELFLVRKSSCKTYEQFCCKIVKLKSRGKFQQKTTSTIQ
jgi:hypothetical protein